MKILRIDTMTGVNGKRYRVPIKEKNLELPTCYHLDTVDDVILILEALRDKETVVRIHLGDVDTGRSWLEENDVIGYIGRSTGHIKIPLLVPEGDCGGPGLLTHCIIGIQQVYGKKWLYKHPLFHSGLNLTGPHNKEIEYKYKVWNNKPELVTQFKTRKEAKQWMDFMNGKSVTVPYSDRQ